MRIIFSNEHADDDLSFKSLVNMVKNDQIFKGEDLTHLNKEFLQDLKDKKRSYFGVQQTIISKDISALKETLQSNKISFERASEVKELLEIPIFANILTKLDVPEFQFYKYLKEVIDREIIRFADIATSKKPSLSLQAKDKLLPAIDFLYFIYMRLFSTNSSSNKQSMVHDLPISWKKINQRLEERTKKDHLELLKRLKKRYQFHDLFAVGKLLVVVLLLVVFIWYFAFGEAFNK